MAATKVLPPSTTPADSDVAGEIVGLDYDDDHVLLAPALRFAVTSRPYGAGGDHTDESRRLIAAVDAALVLRGGGGGGDVDELEINFVYGAPWNWFLYGPSGSGQYTCRHGHAGDITSEHVASWLRFAARRVAGRFTLAVPVLPWQEATTKTKRKLAAELPASARAAAMSLTLGNAILAVVPAAAAAGAFHALGDLALTHARIEPGGADERNLGSLLSAAGCPRLRRLRLEYITGLAALRLDPCAATLEEVNLNFLNDLASLELDAPGLRELRVTGCFGMVDDDAAARISAPNLEALACDTMCLPDRLLSFHGAGSVRRLEKIVLYSHINPDIDDHINAGAIWLLQHCTAADSLDIEISPAVLQMKDGLGTEDTMSRVPQLDNITNLAIDVGPGWWHKLTSTIVQLLAKCSRVERLSMHISSANDTCSKPCCFPNGKDVEKISMEHLREATITGFHPSKYHQSLVQLIMESAPALEKLTLELFIGKELHEDIPCNRGRWAPCVSEESPKGRARTKVYQWTAEKKREEEEGSDGLILSRI